MTVALLSGAMLTPFGALDATADAITRGDRAGALEPKLQLVVARLSATPAGARNARLLGVLPALAVDVARAATVGFTCGPRTGLMLAFGGLRSQWSEVGPAMAEQQADGARAWERGLSRMHPLWMLRYLSNGAHALVAAELGAVGDGATFAGPASAASAIIAADEAIADGVIDHAVILAIDDLSHEEVAVELSVRRPGAVASAAVAAILVGPARANATSLCAADGIDGDNAEPGPRAIAAVTARLARAIEGAPASAPERDVSFAPWLGDAGAARPLVDVLLADRYLRNGWPAAIDLHAVRRVTTTVAASPGQIGIIRVEVPT